MINFAYHLLILHKNEKEIKERNNETKSSWFVLIFHLHQRIKYFLMIEFAFVIHKLNV